jgi:hypothetical protein
MNGKRENFHSNSPVRLKKSLWESRTTATLAQRQKRVFPRRHVFVI